MRHLLPALFAFSAVVAAFAPRAHAATPSASECVAFDRTVTATGILFDVRNECDKDLSCTLGWKLTCENSEGKATNGFVRAARFSVDRGSTHSETGSAESCTGAGWRIDDVTWSCSPVK